MRRYRTSKGIGVEKAFRCVMPYVLRPETWKKQQISKFSSHSTVFAELAGVGLQSEESMAGCLSLPRAKSPWVQWVDLVVRG